MNFRDFYQPLGHSVGSPLVTRLPGGLPKVTLCPKPLIPTAGSEEIPQFDHSAERAPVTNGYAVTVWERALEVLVVKSVSPL